MRLHLVPLLSLAFLLVRWCCVAAAVLAAAGGLHNRRESGRLVPKVHVICVHVHPLSAHNVSLASTELLYRHVDHRMNLPILPAFAWPCISPRTSPINTIPPARYQSHPNLPDTTTQTCHGRIFPPLSVSVSIMNACDDEQATLPSRGGRGVREARRPGGPEEGREDEMDAGCRTRHAVYDVCVGMRG